MPKIPYCGMDNNAAMYKLPSYISVYQFQIAFNIKRCRKCKERHMAWKGEYPSGKATSLIDIPPESFDMWDRMIQAGEAKPEAQLMSDWSYKVAAGDMTAQIEYQTKLCQANRWYKGQIV